MVRALSPRRSVEVTAAVLLGAVAWGVGESGRMAEAQNLRPTLLVLVVVDQMRTDYLTRFADRFSHGSTRDAFSSRPSIHT
jgi:hypothetical protein